MTTKQVEKLILGMTDVIKKYCPFDTGNLQDSIKYERVDETTWRIWVDCGNDPYLKDYPRGFAPYMPFVNEPWISPKWHGKKNPNENWWNFACQEAVEYARLKMNGDVYVRD